MSANQQCVRFNNESMTQVDKTTDAATKTFSASLVHQPGIYQYNEFRYDCTTEGLHTWLAPLVDTTNRIIYSSDIYALMSAFAWLCSHGRADNGLSDKAGRARTSVLRMQCEQTVDFVRSQLTALGITSRKARIMTATANGWDEGHVVVEVLVGGAWKLWDISNNAYYTDASDNHLSLRDLIPAVANDTFKIVKIAGDSISIEPASSGSLDTTVYGRIVLSDLRDWVQKIYQIPGLENGAEVWWCVPSVHAASESWLLSMQSNYRSKTQTVWDAAFYP